ILASSIESGSILLWDVSVNRELGWLRGHTLRAGELVFSRDCKHLASASADGSVRLWDIGERRELAAFRSGADTFWSVAVSPDGNRLAAGTGDGRVVLWDMTTRQHAATFRVQRSGIVSRVHFSPDGQTLYGFAPETIALWRAAPP
ncbi:MAG: hypothetical protein L0Z50_20765, partial [Verrucomicrobiales bacterium]|nr:hypothetical protein [Verrucomicrobiales bacterium]